MVKGNKPQVKTPVVFNKKTTVVKSTPKKPVSKKSTVTKPIPTITRKPTPISEPPKQKKESYPANRFEMTKRKATLTTKATKKIQPPTGWSQDCWNLFQEKRSKLKKDEYLDVKAYFYYGNWLKNRVVNDKFRICCSEVDRPVMEIVVAWLKEHED